MKQSEGNSHCFCYCLSMLIAHSGCKIEAFYYYATAVWYNAAMSVNVLTSRVVVSFELDFNLN